MGPTHNELAKAHDLSGRFQFDRCYDLGAQSDPRYWGNYIDTSNVSGFQEQAYVNKDGLAIRINPTTGYKELFIAGTRSPLEWVQNVAEGIGITATENEELLHAVGGAEKAKLAYQAKYASALDPLGAIALSGVKNISGISVDARDEWADYIDKLVEAEGIEVVYGHSRGSAIMSAMESEVKYISLDGAMIIAHPKSEFLNLQSGRGGVDLALAPNYKNNLVIEDRAFHNVSRPVHTRKKKAKASKEAVTRHKQRSRQKRDRSRHQKTSDRIKVLDKLLGRKRPRDQKVIMEKAIKKQKVKKQLTLLKERPKKRPPKKRKHKRKRGRPFQRS
ncbi:hypothetical protein [Protobacilladnavirus chaelor]|uniref:Hypothetical protein protein n=1 Tax=Protobacilladnavirus chaelor TaxID=3052701 RepID=E9RFF0_9VIRU|nr:hypothetical protein [Protobacilladnavirus chaelor]BAJ79014.1 hypothetical protein [Protobacilladnavirus chaelor]